MAWLQALNLPHAMVRGDHCMYGCEWFCAILIHPGATGGSGSAVIS